MTLTQLSLGPRALTSHTVALAVLGAGSWTSAPRRCRERWSSVCTTSAPRTASPTSRKPQENLSAEAWRCVVRYLWGGRISHRPALLAYHDTLLAIGDGKCGFTLSTIERSVHAAAVGKLTAASVVDKDTENSIKAHLTQRSAGYDKMAKLRALPERSNRARFARLWQLGRPDNLAKKLGGMCVFFACQIWLMEFKNYNEVRRLSTPLTAIRPLCESSLRRLTAVAATASHSALA